jgi:hypothetical protein
MTIEKTAEEEANANKGRFRPGESGNPAGRPKGSRNKVTLAVESLLEGQAETLTQRAIERAMEGDATALRICLDRVLPPRRERPVPFDLPIVREAADCRDALAAVIRAVADGELTPSEATTLAKLIADFAVVDEETRTARQIKDAKARPVRLWPRPIVRGFDDT